MPSHIIHGGKVNIYRRDDGKFWQCSASVGHKQFRVSTGETSLDLAKQFAADWLLTLTGKKHAGVLATGKTFEFVAKQFLKEYEIITEGQRSPRWVEGHGIRLRLHLIPFFIDLRIGEVTASKVQEYRVHRMTSRVDPKTGKPKRPARSTIHDEIVTLRLVLKTAIRHGWLAYLPDLSPPYRTQGKIVHRPWFSPAEYKQLYEATRAYASKPFNSHHQWNAEQVHDFVLFMANTGLRPDEAKNLQHRDVEIVRDEATGERILEIEVRGKRGVGFCKSMPGAVKPYQRLLARALPGLPQGKRARRRRAERGQPLDQDKLQYPKPTDHVFPGNHIRLFNNLLEREDLKLDRDGNRRTAYSLRHTYICMRLMEGADIYQVAKNCRTSVEMIERFYAAHIKNTLDAAAINVRRATSAKKTAKRSKAVPKSRAKPRRGFHPANHHHGDGDSME